MMRRLGFFLAVVLFLSGPMRLTAAQSPDDSSVAITSPQTGEQLFGPVNIVGSAAHPTAFDSYTLEYNDLSDPAAPWFLVQERVTQQVQNGILGTWNTNMVPDGMYRLRLHVFLDDGQVVEVEVSNLRVANTQPTAVPTVPSGGVGAPAAPTPGPPPTSPVEQPPSNNPAAGISGLDSAADDAQAPTSLNDGEAGERTTRVNLDRVRGAFCAGVYLALGGFVVMFAYLLLRGRLRPYARRTVWQPYDESHTDR
jgi:hypothetical protein